MRKLLALVVVLVGVSVCAWGDVGDLLEVMADDDCITADDLQPILIELGADPSLLSVEGPCATIADVSVFLYDAVGLRGTFFERLFGMSVAEKIEVAQRENVMVVGFAEDTLTGIDLYAVFVGLARYLSTHLPRPDWLLLDSAALAELSMDAQRLLPPGALKSLLPGLSPPPPTS